MALDDFVVFTGYGVLLMLWSLLRRRERSLWMTMCVPWMLWAAAEVNVGHINLPLPGLQTSSQCTWKPGPHAGEQQFVCDRGEALALERWRSESAR